MTLSRSAAHLQLKEKTDLDKLYKKYWYASGTNETMRKELKFIVDKVQSVVKLKPDDIWVDIGSNDGTLLSFIPKTINRVGFDPVPDNCETAKQHGVIINDYFNKNTYPYGKPCKVVTAIAMFYDLHDPVAFSKEVYDILDDDGLWVIQMSYLPLMLKQYAFDNICNEHVSYYSLESLEIVLKEAGFKIVDCELNDINGGSFRVFAQKDVASENSFASAPYRDVAQMRVEAYKNQEKLMDLNNPLTYLTWFAKIHQLKHDVYSFIKKVTDEGKTVYAYGASTKGNTLLQFFGLDNTLIKGIAERQERKYGLKTIGTEIPIYSEAYVRAQKPDYMLVLAWHFIAEFKEREKEYLENGGKFIVPAPKFEIIGL
jgi:SAM-dependent methyltransferase